jgi:hypothetical protein
MIVAARNSCEGSERETALETSKFANGTTGLFEAPGQIIAEGFLGPE